MKYTFKGFTEKANKALNLAIESAENLGQTYIGSEHILLGLCKENSGVAYTALRDSGVTAEKLEAMMDSNNGTVALTPNDHRASVDRPVVRSRQLRDPLSARTRRYPSDHRRPYERES